MKKTNVFFFLFSLGFGFCLSLNGCSALGLLLLRIVDLRLQNVVPSADAAEAVCQVVADARTRRLGGLHALCVEVRNDLIDAHQILHAGADGALEEAWRETVRYALENVCLLENLAERGVVSVAGLPLGP